jgi:hypothetical protein
MPDAWSAAADGRATQKTSKACEEKFATQVSSVGGTISMFILPIRSHRDWSQGTIEPYIMSNS